MTNTIITFLIIFLIYSFSYSFIYKKYLVKCLGTLIIDNDDEGNPFIFLEIDDYYKDLDKSLDRQKYVILEVRHAQFTSPIVKK